MGHKRGQFSVNSFLSNSSGVEEELESFLACSTENNATRQIKNRQKRKRVCIWLALSSVALFTFLAFVASFNRDAIPNVQSYWPLRTTEEQAYTGLPADYTTTEVNTDQDALPLSEEQVEVLQETVVDEQLEQAEVQEAKAEAGSIEEPVVQSQEESGLQPQEDTDAMSKEEEVEEVLPTVLKVAEIPQSTQVAQVDNELIESIETEDDTLVAPVPAVQLIDTHPPIPADRSDRGDRKYLAYLPHSGFHNARIELSNVLMVAYLTNRTLVLPSVRLGSPLAWSSKAFLEERLQRTQKDRWVAKCRPRLEELEAEVVSKKDFCYQYLHYTGMSK